MSRGRPPHPLAGSGRALAEQMLNPSADATTARLPRILSFRTHEQKTLRGFLTVELPSGLVLHDCTVHERDGSRWVGLPRKSYTDRDGAEQWQPVVEIPDRARRDRFSEQVLAALGAYLEDSRG